MSDSHISPRRCAPACALLAVLLLLVAAPAGLGAEASPAPGAAPPRQQQIYVPIKEPRLEQAPIEAPAVPPPTRTDKTEAVAAAFDTAASVPSVQIPGTVVPLWWLVLGLLAVPLAQVWRRWTARMFE